MKRYKLIRDLPTFKAAYFGIGVFPKQIILADLEIERKTNEKRKSKG